MKTWLLLSLFITGSAFAQIEGRWLSENKDGEVEMYKEGNKYFGKLVRAKRNKETNNLDVHNPDESEHKNSVVGKVIVKDLKKDGDEWNGGTIYDPKSGKTYKSKAHLEKDGKLLKLRGYIGFSFIGRTSEWTRIEDPSQGIQGDDVVSMPDEAMPGVRPVVPATDSAGAMPAPATTRP